MAKKEHFRDFHLLVLDHPGTSEEAVSNGPRGNAARQKFALEEILKNTEPGNTEPGDLILIEAMERATIEDYKTFHRWKKRHLKEKFDETMSAEWKEGQKRQWNFYAELAELAIANGRRVATLESDVMRPGGRLPRAKGAPNRPTVAGFEFKQEAYLMTVFGRTPNQISRMERRKPKMVISAAGHGAIFEKVLKPKSVTWYEPMDIKRKQKAIEIYSKAIETLRELRQRRRQRINEELMARGKLPKMKARLEKAKRRTPRK